MPRTTYSHASTILASRIALFLQEMTTSNPASFLPSIYLRFLYNDWVKHYAGADQHELLQFTAKSSHAFSHALTQFVPAIHKLLPLTISRKGSAAAPVVLNLKLLPTPRPSDFHPNPSYSLPALDQAPFEVLHSIKSTEKALKRFYNKSTIRRAVLSNIKHPLLQAPIILRPLTDPEVFRPGKIIPIETVSTSDLSISQQPPADFELLSSPPDAMITPPPFFDASPTSKPPTMDTDAKIEDTILVDPLNQ